MRNFRLKLFVVVLIVSWFCVAAAPAQIITSVSRGGTSTNDPPIIAPNPLAEDRLCFVDRTHQYNSIPKGLIGAEYVMVANEDKTQVDYSLKVTLSKAAILCLFLDNRLGHGATVGGNPLMNPDLWSAGMRWVYEPNGPGVFVDTGLNIGIDEQGDGDIDQWASVYVKNSPAGTVTLLPQNDKTDPEGRNIYGVAVLKWRVFQAFWFYNGKINLVQTPDLVTVRSGYYGGWDWFNDAGYWRQPFDDPLPGGPNLWAFTDHLTFLYTDAKVLPVQRWLFFWDPSGQGNCLELIAEDGGSCCPVRPLNPDIIANLKILNHAFSVNADKVLGEFGDLELVPINALEAVCRDLGMTEADLQTFMDGDIINKLEETDPLGHGLVGVQHAHWPMPEPQILCPERLEITEGDTISYPVRLREQPDGPVTVNVKFSDPATVRWADYDEDVYQLHFDPHNWAKPQVVSIAAKYFMDNWIDPRTINWADFDDEPLQLHSDPQNLEKPQVVGIAAQYFFDVWDSGRARLGHYLSSDPTEAAILPVTVVDKKTGRRRYAEADINRDTEVNFKDVAYVANAWLESIKQPPEIDIWDPDVMVSLDIDTSGGSASFDPHTETWTVKGDGKDIWDISDQFHFVYKEFEGDCQMTATILSLEPTDVWAKAGLMIRQTLNPDSAHVSIFVTPHRGVAFQFRPEAGAETQSVHYGPAALLKPPVSLRLVKTGNTVTGYYYNNGRWIEQGSAMKPWPCFVGMAVTSHVEGAHTIATFGKELVDTAPIPLP